LWQPGDGRLNTCRINEGFAGAPGCLDVVQVIGALVVPVESVFIRGSFHFPMHGDGFAGTIR